MVQLKNNRVLIISKPRNNGVRPNRYAGKLLRRALVTADDVIGVAKCPTNGSSL